MNSYLKALLDLEKINSKNFTFWEDNFDIASFERSIMSKENTNSFYCLTFSIYFLIKI